MDCFELTDGHLLGCRTDNASSNHSMTRELQSTFEASGIEWPALRMHLPCMAHIIQLALGALISIFGMKRCTKSRDAHERDQQCHDNERIDIRKSQRLRKEGNCRINKVSAMRPGLPKIIEIVCILWYFESPQTDLHKAENSCGIDYADTLSSKRAHWLATIERQHCATSDYRCEDTLELDPGVTWRGLPIMGIHM